MQKLKSRAASKKVKATFSIHIADAKEVYIAGTFNNWNPKKHLMHQIANGIWEKTVTVPPGIYEYKFLVDGQWKEDPKNELICLNCFGTRNSVIDLSRR